LLLPVTVAVNCNWLGADDPEGGRNAVVGEIETVDGAPPATTIVIAAFALLDGSALLIAVSATGFEAGTAAGAK